MTALVELLREGRRRELEQALFYRLLASDAEVEGAEALAERFNELLADEQHHVSRLTARLLELGEAVDDARAPRPQVPPLGAWEAEAREREAAEVAWYGDALQRVEDPATRALLEEIADSERHHHEALAGKWMPAGTTQTEDPEKQG